MTLFPHQYMPRMRKELWKNTKMSKESKQYYEKMLGINMSTPERPCDERLRDAIYKDLKELAEKDKNGGKSCGLACKAVRKVRGW